MPTCIILMLINLSCLFITCLHGSGTNVTGSKQAHYCDKSNSPSKQVTHKLPSRWRRQRLGLMEVWLEKAHTPLVCVISENPSHNSPRCLLLLFLLGFLIVLHDTLISRWRIFKRIVGNSFTCLVLYIYDPGGLIYKTVHKIVKKIIILPWKYLEPKCRW